MSKKIYVVVYNEDAFQGLELPADLKGEVEKIMKYNDEVFTHIFTNVKEYHSFEVECASQARKGSNGTDKINSMAELYEWLEDKGFELNDGSEVRPEFFLTPKLHIPEGRFETENEATDYLLGVLRSAGIEVRGWQ